MADALGGTTQVNHTTDPEFLQSSEVGGSAPGQTVGPVELSEAGAPAGPGRKAAEVAEVQQGLEITVLSLGGVVVA